MHVCNTATFGGVWFAVYGVRCIVYGLWFTVYSVRFMVYSLRPTVYSLLHSSF